MTETTTMTIDDLPRIVERGLIPDNLYLKAVSFLRHGDFWKKWALNALFALAIGHILSGIIFFFAFNWNDLSSMTKFAVVASGILASLVAWIVSKLDSPAGQAFGIAATVLVGVMFAVLGQVYQSPAMIHTPFMFWAILTLPFALASRNLAHWTVWLVIFVVAVTTYANSGLRLAGNDTAANGMNILVSTGFVGGLIFLDKILSPRLAWANGEWFRVLLVLSAIGFAFFGFTESFWDGSSSPGNAFWLLATAVVIGLIAYLYYRSPSVATLSLATFGAFTLVAQFGFKLFEAWNEGAGIFFMVFIWLGGLMVGMVAIFRHYLRRFRRGSGHVTAEAVPQLEVPEKSATAFDEYMGFQDTPVAQVLASETERDNPWYISVFLAVAGVITAIMGCAFVFSFMALFLRNADEAVFGVLGLLIFAITIFLRRKTNSQYAQHMLNTLIIVGGALAAFGFGVKISNFDGVVLWLLTLSLLVLVLVRDRILEFLAAAAIITLIGIEIYHLKVPMTESLILVIATVVGVFLLTRPIARRLYTPAATAFLMAPAFLGIALVHIHRWENLIQDVQLSNDWIARVISLGLLLGGVIYLNRGKSLTEFNPQVMVLLPLVIGAALMPLGGASALLLILAGYILGSRTLAIVGTLLQIYFLTMFYYDLSLSLLTKSIILFVSGLIFLAVWYSVHRKQMVAP